MVAVFVPIAAAEAGLSSVLSPVVELVETGLEARPAIVLRVGVFAVVLGLSFWMVAVVVLPAALFAVFFVVVLVFFLVAAPAIFFLVAVSLFLDVAVPDVEDFFFVDAVLLSLLEARALVAFFAVDALLVEPDAATSAPVLDLPVFFELGFCFVFFLSSTVAEDDLRGRVANSHPHEQKTVFAPARLAVTEAIHETTRLANGFQRFMSVFNARASSRTKTPACRVALSV